MRPSRPLNINEAPKKTKRKPKRSIDQRWIMLGGGLLGLILTVAIGLGVYYLVMVNKLQPESAVFTGISDLVLEDIAEEYEEEIRTDVTDDVEAARAHEAQFELLLAAEEEYERSKRTSESGDTSSTKSGQSNTGSTVAAGQAAPAPVVPQSLPGIRRDPNVRTFLVIGVDSRSNDFSGRSDAMMIVAINYNTGRINMASLFRGAYVQIPGHGWSMLNHAYAWGGISLLKQTVENNFRVGIDDFIIFNFGAFTNAINAIGGVDITLTAAEANALGMSPGTNHMNSWQALNYARLRSIDWDFNRMGRQRQVIAAVVGKLTYADIGTINAAVASVLSSTATSLGQGQVASLTANLPSLLNYGRGETTIPLPGTRQAFYKNGMEMWSFDFASNINHLHLFLYGY